MAFFSGQDNKMLQQEGNDTNCFVSLVVDTRGTYVAAITRKVSTKSEVTVKSLGTSYEFFGEGTKQLTKDDTQTVKVVDKTFIEYYSLDIDRHEVPNTLDYLDTRFAEIVDKKKQSPISRFFADIHPSTPTVKEPTLFSDSEMGKVEKATSLTDEWTPNPKLLNKAIATMLSCSLIINPDKFDLKQWVRKNMVGVYDRIFNKDASNSQSVLGAFDEWKEFIVDYILDHFEDPDMPVGIEIDDYMRIMVESILDILYEYSSDNLYIKAYCDTLEQYL